MDIQITGLTKYYGEQAAVDHVDMEVRTGEILGFLGPNGAGKSTTMRSICGSVIPDEGEIIIGGRSIREEPLAMRGHIGYLPENNPLYEDMPVLDLLRFTAKLQGMANADIPARIKSMVGVCGLEREKHKRIGELSKGFRQRVGLAQALVHDPQVLILDEPTSGLDPNQIVEIRQLIKEIGQAKTVIFSTHILSEVEATCDRILIINKGRIVANGSPAALREQAQGHELFVVRIEDGPPEAIVQALQGLPNVSNVETNEMARFTLHLSHGLVGRDIFHLCMQHGWVLSEAYSKGRDLEGVFMELTRES